MPTISNSLALLALALPARAQATVPIAAAACPAHLQAIAPKLAQSGYAVSWTQEASRVLHAAHIEPLGRVTIEYRCGATGLAVTVVNHGLPDIPLHVLLAAGPGATLSQAIPEWLRERDRAVRD